MTEPFCLQISLLPLGIPVPSQSTHLSKAFLNSGTHSQPQPGRLRRSGKYLRFLTKNLITSHQQTVALTEIFEMQCHQRILRVHWVEKEK